VQGLREKKTPAASQPAERNLQAPKQNSRRTEIPKKSIPILIEKGKKLVTEDVLKNVKYFNSYDGN
jgi:hypothetical protein